VPFNKHLNNILFLIAIFILTSLSYWFVNVYERYHLNSHNIIHNSQFNNQFESWELKDKKGISVNKGVLQLHSNDTASTTKLTQDITDLAEKTGLYLTIPVKLQGVQTTSGRWRGARIVLQQWDKNGHALYHLPHILLTETGSSDWVAYKDFFKISPETELIKLDIRLSSASGTLFLKTPVLVAAVEKADYVFISWVLLTGWLIIAFFIIQQLLSEVSTTIKIIGAITATLIFSGILLPGEYKNIIENYFYTNMSFLQNFTDSYVLNKLDVISEDNHVRPSKLGHFAFFTFFALLFIRLEKYKFLKTLTYVIALAMISELMQNFTKNRSPSLNDIYIDIAGIMSGILLVFISSNIKQTFKNYDER
jgi:VanZ family protein